MAFLDAVNALRMHGETEVEVLGRRHPAAVVAGKPDGQQAPLVRLCDRRHQVLGVARRRQRDRDVAVACVGDDLTLEDQLESDIVAQRGHHSLIGGERPCRDRAPPRRTAKQCGQRGGVGGTAAVAQRVEPAATKKPLGHRDSRRGQPRCVLVQRFPLQPSTFGGLATCRCRQVIEKATGVGLLRLDERIQDTRALRLMCSHWFASSQVSSSRVIAAPACTRTRSLIRTSPRMVVSTHSSPLAVRTNACPATSAGSSTISPSRPSSLHVTQTVSSSVGFRSPGCSKQTWVSSHSRWYIRTNLPVAGTIGSSESIHRMWFAAPAGGRGPEPIHSVSTPHAGVRRIASTTAGSFADATASRRSPGLVATRTCATGSGSTSATDGSARLPMITG